MLLSTNAGRSTLRWGPFPQVLFFPKGLFPSAGRHLLQSPGRGRKLRSRENDPPTMATLVHCQSARHREADMILLERAADAQFPRVMLRARWAGSTEGNALLELRSVTVGVGVTQKKTDAR